MTRTPVTYRALQNRSIAQRQAHIIPPPSTPYTQPQLTTPPQFKMSAPAAARAGVNAVKSATKAQGTLNKGARRDPELYVCDAYVKKVER